MGDISKIRTTDGVDHNIKDNRLVNYAPLSSPALTDTPTAPTAASGTNTTQIATTAFVQGEISNVLGNIETLLAAI